jgi:hypothetical protein
MPVRVGAVDEQDNPSYLIPHLSNEPIEQGVQMDKKGLLFQIVK